MSKPKAAPSTLSADNPSDKAVLGAADGERVYILADVVAALGDASEAEVRVDFEGLSEADFVAKGRRIGTPRLAKELARNYGIFADWLPGATREQRELLGFVDKDWLRVATWAARQAEIQHEAQQRGAHGSTADKQVREVAAETLAAEGKRVRDRLRSALNYLSGGLALWKVKVDTAYAAAVTGAPVADAIEAMAAVGDQMLADTSPGMLARRSKSKLTAESLQNYRALAGELSRAMKAAQAVKSAAPVSQSDVDLWDGMALTYFEQFVDAVDDAREADPTIPRPSIIGLRSFFRRLSRKKTDGPDGGAADEGEGDGGEAAPAG
jgi:hypothetical protein